MGQFIVCSTFHPAGLALYGRRMMRTFVEHWPEDVMLAVYRENWAEKVPGVLFLDLARSDWLSDFKARHAWRDTKNYRMDAVRFAHKIAALIDCDTWCKERYLIWLDGDTVTHSPLPLEALERWAPKQGEWISWLDRDRVYPECGFYIIDRMHPRHTEAMAALRDLYANDQLFLENEWHDSYVLWQMVKRLELPARSLSGDARSTHHPFINSELGAYMDHVKGKRKLIGKSKRIDLKKSRKESYWR